MKCPHCPDATLTMADRQGVEIDYCPQCRGVWLDRGELDKLIDRAAASSASAAPVAASAQTQPMRPAYASQQDFRDSDYRGHAGHYPRRKKSWLSEIFD